MFDVSPPEALLRALILVIPAMLLLLLVFLALRRVRVRGHAKSNQPLKAFDLPASNETPAHSRATDNKADHTPMELLAPALDRTVSALEARIKAAEAKGETSILARLYIELGRSRRDAGLDKEALTALRSAAGISAKHGPKSAHAAARMELAEAAYRAGDLTTACEHWQLARAALQDDGQVKASAHVDKLMRDHGCPTDWVLTDF